MSYLPPLGGFVFRCIHFICLSVSVCLPVFVIIIKAVNRSFELFISRRALAREGDYEMMPVCAGVRACVR